VKWRAMGIIGSVMIATVAVGNSVDKPIVSVLGFIAGILTLIFFGWLYYVEFRYVSRYVENTRVAS
jgi:hypothetical protein